MTQTMEPAKDWKGGCKIYLEGGGEGAASRLQEERTM